MNKLNPNIMLAVAVAFGTILVFAINGLRNTVDRLHRKCLINPPEDMEGECDWIRRTGRLVNRVTKGFRSFEAAYLAFLIDAVATIFVMLTNGHTWQWMMLLLPLFVIVTFRRKFLLERDYVKHIYLKQAEIFSNRLQNESRAQIHALEKENKEILEELAGLEAQRKEIEQRRGNAHED